MANVADTLATGPASKNQVSGGKKFPLNRQGSFGANKRMNNQSNEAQRAIMSLKIGAVGTFPKMSENVMTGKKAPR